MSSFSVMLGGGEETKNECSVGVQKKGIANERRSGCRVLTGRKFLKRGKREPGINKERQQCHNSTELGRKERGKRRSRPSSKL